MGKKFRATMEQQQEYERRYGFADDPLHVSPPVAVVPGRPGRLCSVCTHEHREKIDELVRGKSSIRAVAKQFAISFSSLQRHVKNHLPELRSGTAERLPEDLKVERQPDRSFIRRIESRWCEVPGKGSFEVAPAKAEVVTVGPVGLFVAKRECIGPNQCHYLEGDVEIWPLDLELALYWQRVETTGELKPEDAGKGKYKQKKRWRTASDGMQTTAGMRKLTATDVAKMQRQVLKDRLEERRAAMDFRPI